MIWRISDFPELDHLEPAQRNRVLVMMPWWTYPIIIGRSVIGSMILSTGLAGIAGYLLQNKSAFIAGFLTLFPILAVAIYLLQLRRVRNVTRQTIFDSLQGEFPPFCFSCGYDLRGHTGVQCPECGSLLTT